ncbi:hypothetical protein BDZ89DRAFT_1076078 [Hymenopellis radicata]|nr:hypothetical protein BDZ89DRAFT_1076078 [Hymenopellis radicata]
MGLVSNITDLSLRYPDDESEKPVYLEIYSYGHCTSGNPLNIHLHARFYWVNGRPVADDSASTLICQVIELERRGDRYFYVEPNVKELSLTDACRRQPLHPLGKFSRDKREQLLELAADIAEEVIADTDSATECPIYKWRQRLVRMLCTEGVVTVAGYIATLASTDSCRNFT